MLSYHSLAPWGNGGQLLINRVKEEIKFLWDLPRTVPQIFLKISIIQRAGERPTTSILPFLARTRIPSPEAGAMPVNAVMFT